MSRPAALAVCTTAIGDTVLCTPAISSLGAAYELDVLVHQKRMPLLLGNPYVSLLYPYRNNFLFRTGLWLRLARKHYHRLVILHANNDILKLVKRLDYELAGCIQGWNRPDLGMVCFKVDEGTHIVDARLALAAWAGAPPVEFHPTIHLLPGELSQARDWLEGQAISARPLVGLCPGSAYPFKAWPAERYGELAAALMEQGIAVLIFGAVSERPLAQAISKAAGREVPAALGLELRAICGLLASLDLLISNDTGPLHLGAAVGTKVLGLFGPTDPDTIAPRQKYHHWLRVPRTCDPCLTKACTKSECMPALETETVLSAALEMLSAKPAGAAG